MLSFPPSPSVRIFIGRQPVDMRKGFDGLSGVVIEVVDEDPQSGHLFVFFNKRRDRMKAIVPASQIARLTPWAWGAERREG